MTLQGSGTISMSNINTELGRGCCPTISLDTAENGGYVAINTLGFYYPQAGNPAAISEWYNYNHTYNPCPAYGQFLYQACCGGGTNWCNIYTDGACGTYGTVACYGYFLCGGPNFLCQ